MYLRIFYALLYISQCIALFLLSYINAIACHPYYWKSKLLIHDNWSLNYWTVIKHFAIYSKSLIFCQESFTACHKHIADISSVFFNILKSLWQPMSRLPSKCSPLCIVLPTRVSQTTNKYPSCYPLVSGLGQKMGKQLSHEYWNEKSNFWA